MKKERKIDEEKKEKKEMYLSFVPPTGRVWHKVFFLGRPECPVAPKMPRRHSPKAPGDKSNPSSEG